MKKRILLCIGLVLLCIALTVASYYLWVYMGNDPSDFRPIRPIGPIVPPPITLPKV